MLVLWSLCLPFAHLHYLCIDSQETRPLLGALGFRETQTSALGDPALDRAQRAHQHPQHQLVSPSWRFSSKEAAIWLQLWSEAMLGRPRDLRWREGLEVPSTYLPASLKLRLQAFPVSIPLPGTSLVFCHLYPQLWRSEPGAHNF